MKLICRWVVGCCAISVILLIYLSARYESEHSDKTPLTVLTPLLVQPSPVTAAAAAAHEENDEFYDSEQDSVGGPLLFPVRDRRHSQALRSIAAAGSTYSTSTTSPDASVSYKRSRHQTTTISDSERGGNASPTPGQTPGVKMLTDDKRTVIEMPWSEIAQLLKQCSLLGNNDVYYSLGDLPTASIIVTFHSGETWYNLLHTLHSIFQRTPAHLLHEVILIDDFSNKDDFSDLLEIYTRTVFGEKVKLHRNNRNLGLIRSRLIGSQLARGDVIIVMDSHSEVQSRWLEPLLYEVKKNRKTFANSNIDWMFKKDDQWHYKYSGVAWTVYFDWRLNFGWQAMSKEVINEQVTQITDPFRIKVNIGAYGAIDRAFFNEIGAYDDGMELWGGENIDLSLRTWLFGGQVLSVPCSRVSHLEQAGSRDYRNNFTKVIQKNYKRIVDVWFDEYSRLFFLYQPALASIDAGDISSRLSLKSRAQHNFTWFLQNVFPELDVFDVSSLAWGQVVNVGSKLCMDFNSILSTYTCSKTGFETQMFFWSQKNELRRDSKIITVQPIAEGKFFVVLNDYMDFYGNDRGTKWTHWQGGPLMDSSTNLCLEAGAITTALQMKKCNPGLLTQQWNFTHYNVQQQHHHDHFMMHNE